MSIRSIFNRNPYASEADKAWDNSPFEPVTPTGITQPSRSEVVKPFTHERLPLETRIQEVENRLKAFEESIKTAQQQYS